jgi:hypothetical protein
VLTVAKCKKCGKGGFFQKLNEKGLCSNCAINERLQIEESNLQAHIELLKGEISKIQLERQEVESDRQKIYNTIKRQAECAAVASVQNQINALNAECSKLQAETDSIKAKHANVSEQFESLEKKYIKVKTLFESYQASNKQYLKNNETYLDDRFLISLSPTVELPLNCMNVKKLKALYNQNKKLIQDCLNRYDNRYTTKTNSALYKLMVIALEAELQNILYNINYGKLETATDAVKETTMKYLAIAIDGNQSIAPTMKKFIYEIEYLFLEAVKIEYEYYVQKERIKEEQRALREQMKQEAEERRLLEEQRRQVEKEESKYKTEMDNVQALISNTQDLAKINQLEQRLAQLQKQLSEVENKKDDILRLQNGKAGYVYIISNLGSFGENVFKVGMTRRLEPMDRVKELGDASVPFAFDVHSFIFSDDAVGLENNLHKALNEKRVNKINLRKEFFKVSIDEIENKVYEYQPSAEFNRTMLAEEYYQSLSTAGVREVISNYDDEE